MKKKFANANACPCHSGRKYGECCGPRHDGSRPAETPEALMRSRFAAFALGLGDYLVDTLSASHEDRAPDRAALVQALSRAKDTQRFLGLEIRETHAEGDHGEVLFHARIFERGVDKSFTERSAFAKETASGATRAAKSKGARTATIRRYARRVNEHVLRRGRARRRRGTDDHSSLTISKATSTTASPIRR